MTVEDKIKSFEKMVITAAEERKHQATSEMESRFSSIVDDEVREEIRKSQETVRSERYRIEREKNKKLVEASSHAKRKFISYRQDLTDELFNLVLEDIKKFTMSPEYEDFLISKINTALRNGRYESVQLTSNDMRYAQTVSSASGLQVEEALDDFIGGFRLITEGRHAIADHTFLGGFNEQRANFSLIVAESI